MFFESTSRNNTDLGTMLAGQRKQEEKAKDQTLQRQDDNGPDPQKKLFKAVQDGEVEKICQLLDNLEQDALKTTMQTPLQPSSKSKVLFKTTFLHIAARRRDLDSFNTLMDKLERLSPNDKKAVLNAKDSGGKSALHVTVEEGLVDAAERLILDGAKIGIEDSMRQTPLHVAVIRSNEDIALSLLEFKVTKSTSETPRQDQTPLATSSEAVHELLIMQDVTGKTALHHGCMTGKPQLVILILAATPRPKEPFLNTFLNKPRHRQKLERNDGSILVRFAGS